MRLDPSAKSPAAALVAALALFAYACADGSFSGAGGKKSEASKSKQNTGTGTADATDDGNDDGTGTAGDGGKTGSDGGDDGSTAGKSGTGTGDAPEGDDDGTTTGGTDDLGTDDGQNATLLAPLKLSQVVVSKKDADCDAKVYVQRLDDNGNKVGAEVEVKFKESQATTQEVPGICNKQKDTAIETRWNLCGSNITPAITGSVKRTGGGGNSVEVVVDDEEDGDCLLGSCVDPGKDNTFRYECPNADKVLNIKGLQ